MMVQFFFQGCRFFDEPSVKIANPKVLFNGSGLSRKIVKLNKLWGVAIPIQSLLECPREIIGSFEGVKIMTICVPKEYDMPDQIKSYVKKIKDKNDKLIIVIKESILKNVNMLTDVVKNLKEED